MYITFLVRPSGLTATSLRLVATKEGGIEISSETQSSGGSGLSGGAIGGIVAGVIVGILALLCESQEATNITPTTKQAAPLYQMKENLMKEDLVLRLAASQ